MMPQIQIIGIDPEDFVKAVAAELAKSIPEPQPEEKLMTIAQVAEFLGLSDRTVRHYVFDLGLFPVYGMQSEARCKYSEVVAAWKLIEPKKKTTPARVV